MLTSRAGHEGPPHPGRSRTTRAPLCPPAVRYTGKLIGAVALNPHQEGRRAFPRYNVNFAVRFATVQDFVLEYAANISAGGVFVHTENPPPLKTVVQVEMELPGGGSAVPARGLVVHRVTPQDAQRRGTVPGIGIQFMDADDEFRRRIDSAITHILETERAAYPYTTRAPGTAT